MHNKKALLAVLFLITVLLGGCETTAGAAKGVACGIGSTAEGVGKDTVNLWSALMKLDNWIRENLW